MLYLSSRQQSPLFGEECRFRSWMVASNQQNLASHSELLHQREEAGLCGCSCVILSDHTLTHTDTHTLDLISASAQSKVPAYLSFPLTVILPGHFTLLQHPLSSLISLCLPPSTLPPLMHLDEGFFHTRHSRNLNLFYQKCCKSALHPRFHCRQKHASDFIFNL